jgi:hypothetical protein
MQDLGGLITIHRLVRGVFGSIARIERALEWSVFGAALMIGVTLVLFLLATTLLRTLSNLRAARREEDASQSPPGFDRLLKPHDGIPEQDANDTNQSPPGFDHLLKPR